MNKTIKLMLCAIVVALTSFSFTNCAGFAEDQIKQAIAAMNKEYPKEITTGITCRQIITEGKDVIYDCVIDSENVGLEAFKSEDIKNSIFESIKEGYHSDDNLKTFIDFVVTANMGVKYRFTDEASGQKVEIAYDNDALAGI